MASLASQLSSRRLARAEARQSHSELKMTLCNLIDKDERFAQHIRTALEEYQRKVAEEQAVQAKEEAARAAPEIEPVEPEVRDNAELVEITDTDAAIQEELTRVKALSDEERAAVGKKYNDPEELWCALEAGSGDATHVLRASWLKTQRGGRLPKRGDELPPEAIITVAELRQIAKASMCTHGALPVIALSHFWRTKGAFIGRHRSRL